LGREQDPVLIYPRYIVWFRAERDAGTMCRAEASTAELP